MKLKIFSVYDNKAGAYLAPWSTTARGLALRAFAAAAQQQEHDFSKYSNDFCLYEVAEFDDQTGLIEPHKEHVNLGLAAQYKEIRQ